MLPTSSTNTGRHRSLRMASSATTAATDGESNSNAATVDDRAVRVARRREKRRQRHERAEWWSTKLHAFLWVVSAITALIVSDFINVCMNSNQVARGSLTFGGILFVLVTLGVIRMTLWFPKSGESAEAEFERAHPNFVLATTLGGVFSYIFLCIGVWPVYRIFAPFLLALFWFGMIMVLHFLP